MEYNIRYRHDLTDLDIGKSIEIKLPYGTSIMCERKGEDLMGFDQIDTKTRKALRRWEFPLHKRAIPLNKEEERKDLIEDGHSGQRRHDPRGKRGGGTEPHRYDYHG